MTYKTYMYKGEEYCITWYAHLDNKKLNVKAGSYTNVKAGSYTNVKAGSYTNVKPGSYTNVKAGSYTNVKAGSYINVKAGSYTNVKAGSYTKLEYMCVWLVVFTVNDLGIQGFREVWRHQNT